ncbi:MAG: hypothetical protein DRJ15_14100, partial [Bacteroidetes bacterium]
ILNCRYVHSCFNALTKCYILINKLRGKKSQGDKKNCYWLLVAGGWMLVAGGWRLQTANS